MSRVILQKRKKTPDSDTEELSPVYKKSNIRVNLTECFHTLFPIFQESGLKSLKPRNSTPHNSKLAKHIGYATIVFYLTRTILNIQDDKIGFFCSTVYRNLQSKWLDNECNIKNKIPDVISEITHVNNNEHTINNLDYDNITSTISSKFDNLVDYIAQRTIEQEFSVFRFPNVGLNLDMIFVPLESDITNIITREDDDDDDKNVTLTLQFNDDFYSIWNIFYTVRQMYIMHFIPKFYDYISFKFTSDFSSIKIVSRPYIIKHILTTIPLMLSIRHLESPNPKSDVSPVYIGPFARTIAKLFESNKRFELWLAIRFISLLFYPDSRRDSKDIINIMPEYDTQLKSITQNLTSIMKLVHPIITLENIHDYMMFLSSIADFNDNLKCITLDGLIRLITVYNTAVQKGTYRNPENMFMLKCIIEDIIYPKNNRIDSFEKQIETNVFYTEGCILYDTEYQPELTWNTQTNGNNSPQSSPKRFSNEPERYNIIIKRNGIIRDRLIEGHDFPMSLNSVRPRKTGKIRDTDITLLEILLDESIFTDPEDVLYILTNKYDKTLNKKKIFSKNKRQLKDIFRDLKTYGERVTNDQKNEDILSSHIALLMAYRFIYNNGKKFTHGILNKMATLMTENINETCNFYTTDKNKKIQYVLPLATSIPDEQSSFIFNSIFGPSFGQLIVMMNEMDFLIPIF